MSKTTTIIIANKCRINITQSAEVFTTRLAKSRVFNIPHSQIESRKGSSIAYNEVHDEPATEYTITNWLFGKIKEDLESMHKHDYKIVEDKTNKC